MMMRKGSTIFLLTKVAPLAFMLPAPAAAQDAYEVAWSRQLGTTGWDLAWGVAVDDGGNVFVSGDTGGDLGGPRGGTDAFLAKYDEAGTLLWVQQTGSSSTDTARAVAADSAGNALIVGRRGGPIGGGAYSLVAKYDPSGAPLWVRQYGEAFVASYVHYAVTADSAGNVLAAGWMQDASTFNHDAALQKYSAGGTLLWTRNLGTRREEWAQALAVDAAGDVYIGGHTESSLAAPFAGGRTDAFLAKYSSDGALLWTRQVGSPGDDYAGTYQAGFGAARTLTVDSAGAVYLCGTAGGDLGGPGAGGSDSFLAKYDAAGNQLWIRQVGTPGNDYARALMLTHAGDVFLWGFTADTPWSAGREFIASYDSAGNLLSMAEFDTPALEPEGQWRAAAFDDEGALYLAGHLYDPATLDNDAIVVKLLPVACAADCDGSGDLTFFDFLCFQNQFGAGDPGADCDGDRTLTFFDFLCFQNAFAAGCP